MRAAGLAARNHPDLSMAYDLANPIYRLVPRGLNRLRKDSTWESLCIRARLQSCRRRLKIGNGLQPLRDALNSFHNKARLFPQPVKTGAFTLALLGCALSSFALEPSTALANYGRQAWVMENGLPQNTVQALAQTDDGFIWLGTEVGLVRFDGNGFQVFDQNSIPALPGNDVRCLLATIDGA